MSRAKVRSRELRLLDIEVNLNKSPVLEVKVVDPGIIKAEWNLPEITFSFFSRKEMRLILYTGYDIKQWTLVCNWLDYYGICMYGLLRVDICNDKTVLHNR